VVVFKLSPTGADMTQFTGGIIAKLSAKDGQYPISPLIIAGPVVQPNQESSPPREGRFWGRKIGSLRRVASVNGPSPGRHAKP